MEAAVAGVGNGPVGLQDLKEATAVDGHVQWLLGSLQAAGSEDLLRTDHTHTGTQLQAGRQFTVLAGLATRLATDLIQQILELGASTLEAGGRNVGQVVSNGGQVHVLSGQTGLADPQCRKHIVSPRVPVLRRRVLVIS